MEPSQDHIRNEHTLRRFLSGKCEERSDGGEAFQEVAFGERVITVSLSELVAVEDLIVPTISSGGYD